MNKEKEIMFKIISSINLNENPSLAVSIIFFILKL